MLSVKKTGQVTLSHAGSNGIYCYETISCKFSKTTLDLNKLKYIHVSAGSQKVPIRNLTISFEQIADLHPTFDKDFKRGDNASLHPQRPQGRDGNPSPDTKEPSDEKPSSFINKAINAIGVLFGYDPDGKKFEPCPYSVNCFLQQEPKHMKEYSHPCPYSELCRSKDKEPHLTHELHRVEPCSSKSSCDRLDDPLHRAKYRHTGYPDFLIPCRDGPSCSNKSSMGHRIKYSHGEQIPIPKDKTPGAPYASPSPAKVSSDYPEETSYAGGRNDRRTPCRYGSDCRHQKKMDHCAEYSHPQDGGSKASASSSHDRKPCRYGSDCRDQKKMDHCAEYSHPHERDSKPSASSSHAQKPCRHGQKCWDQDDPQHCSEYSHPPK